MNYDFSVAPKLAEWRNRMKKLEKYEEVNLILNKVKSKL
jgi:hypothetical protein